MSVLTAKRSKKPTPAEAVFLLENGATMDQPTFHELYKLTPEGFKAELIGGTVFVASPVSGFHAAPHAKLVAWMILYMDATPGVDVYDNPTNILENSGEPQPDAALLLSPEVGGRTRMDDKGYILTGAAIPKTHLGEPVSPNYGVKVETLICCRLGAATCRRPPSRIGKSITAFLSTRTMEQTRGIPPL